MNEKSPMVNTMGPLSILFWSFLQALDVGGLWPLGTIGNLEADPLALVEGLESITLDGRKMHKHIRTVRLLDETEAL